MYSDRLRDHRAANKKSKLDYYNNLYLTSENKAKCSWQIVKNDVNLKPLPKYPSTFEDENGRPFTNYKEAASGFNSYFVDSIGKPSSKGLNFSVREWHQNCSSMLLYPVTLQEIEKIIIDISKTDAAGEDAIPCSLLRRVSDIIAPIFVSLVNGSFESGVFPSKLKSAIIRPIYKKGERERIDHYRAVAILPAFSKIFEKAFYTRLLSFFDKHGFLPDVQYGFRRGRCTGDAVLATVNYIMELLDQKLQVAGVFFDYTRAFDLVNHKLLLRKLHHYGVRGLPWSWLDSYLSGRTQKVKLIGEGTECYSDYLTVESGVPQASILGPLLFLIFIADIVDDNPASLITLFVDDMTAIATADSVTVLRDRAANIVDWTSQYSDKNGLVLNPKKTEMIMFSTRPLDFSLLVNLNHETIRQGESVRFLGIHIDSHLSWNAHIDYILKKTFS